MSAFADGVVQPGEWSTLDPVAREAVAELFQQTLARLDHDHGRKLSAAVCSWLAVARHGLFEREILDLLARAGEATPPLAWRRFYRALQPYLRQQNEDDEGDDLVASPRSGA